MLGGIYGKLPIISASKNHITSDNMQWNINQAMISNYDNQNTIKKEKKGV